MMMILSLMTSLSLSTLISRQNLLSTSAERGPPTVTTNTEGESDSQRAAKSDTQRRTGSRRDQGRKAATDERT